MLMLFTLQSPALKRNFDHTICFCFQFYFMARINLEIWSNYYALINHRSNCLGNQDINDIRSKSVIWKFCNFYGPFWFSNSFFPNSVKQVTKLSMHANVEKYDCVIGKPILLSQWIMFIVSLIMEKYQEVKARNLTIQFTAWSFQSLKQTFVFFSCFFEFWFFVSSQLLKEREKGKNHFHCLWMFCSLKTYFK